MSDADQQPQEQVDAKAWHQPMTPAEYHAHPAQGSSMLECFYQSRREYFELYVAKTKQPKPPSEEMHLGTMIHCRLLTPDRWDETVAVMQDKSLDGSDWNFHKPAHREQRDAIKEMAEAQGLILAKQADVDRVAKIVAAIRAHERAGAIVDQPGAQFEYPIFWIDNDTGIECKCMIDAFAAYSADLKTTGDAHPQQWSRRIVDLGYHRRIAHYRSGVNALAGAQCPFVHICAETTEPYRVAVYELDDRDERLAEKGVAWKLGVHQRKRVLHELAECRRTNDWREPWEKGIVRLSLPGWAYKDDLWG